MTKKVAHITTIQDIYLLRNIVNAYDQIDIDACTLKTTGTLRHALKHALFAIKVGGTLNIHDEPSQTYGYSRKKIDFWQVRYQTFLSLSGDCDEVLVDSTKGQLVLQRVRNRHNNEGISFGLVFSGADDELSILIPALDSCIAQTRLDVTEIIVCGPIGWDINRLPAYIRDKVRYLPFGFTRSSSRFLIQEKKKFLYENAQYNVVALSHARILYPPDFAEKLLHRPIEFGTPRVIAVQNGYEFTYLGYTFIGDYDVTKADSRRSFGGELADDDFLHYMRHRVPYIGGGLLVLNKNIVSSACFNPNISWGEAEDIDLSMRVSTNGHLIDYWPDIKCRSQTTKYEFDGSFKKRMARRLGKILLKIGYF